MIISIGSHFPMLELCLYEPRERGLQCSWIFSGPIASKVGLVQSHVKPGTCGGLRRRSFTHCCAIKMSEHNTLGSQ